MDLTAFSMNPAVASKSPKLVQMLLTPFDELLELDLLQARIRFIRHTGGKYLAPMGEAPYEDALRYALEYMIHPSDRDAYLAFHEFSTLRERLDTSETPGILQARFRFKLIAGGWRWGNEVVVGGAANGAPDGVAYSFLFDDGDAESGQNGAGDSFAMRSELTGLRREDSFFTVGRRLLGKYPEGWCVLVIDIEQFKLFNDWYGREKGDLLLAQVGATLNRVEQDTGGIACYFGQDDFALFVPRQHAEIDKLFETIHALIMENGTSVGFMPAFGICRAEDGQSIEELYDRAAVAARYAKENYHTRIRTFDPSMYQKTDADYRILAEFQKALQDHELYIVLQPQCRTTDGKIVGAESLARWRKPDGSMVSPGTFVPVLERYGFVTDMDTYIWEEVCAWQKSWVDRGHLPMPVSVNVSQIDIYTIDVPDFFEELLRKYDLPVDAIKIEITESAYVENEKVIDTVRRLREKGFLVLMDDFGSGYSSLNMLRNLSIDIIKLDAHFLRMSGEDRKGFQIMETIANMARTMGVPIIVEGVETQEELNYIDRLDCKYVQGYFFYRPMPVSDYEKLIGSAENVDAGGFFLNVKEKFRIRDLLFQNVMSDEMLNNILGPVGIFTLNGDKAKLMSHNRQLYDEFGAEELHEGLRTPFQLVVEEDRQEFLALIERAEQAVQSGAEGTIRFCRRNGTVVRVHLQLFYFGEDDGKKKFYVSVHKEPAAQ